jgi:hypothetical protein
MSVFDDISRQDKEGRPDGEAMFAYTNRSGRDEAQRVRNKIDEWVDTYPELHREKLIARLRSVNDDQHRSAFFELFIFCLLHARGHKIIDIEPKLDHTDKSPDFLAETPNQERFYVEAAMATGLSNQEVAAHARLSTALAAIDATPSPAHFLDLKVTGTPSKPISINKLKRELKSWIAALPKDESAKDRAPFVWKEHDSEIQVSAWTRTKPGDNQRAIGVRRTPVIRVDPSREIRPTLKKKATRYGKLDHPYLVALDAMGTHHRDEAVIDALLGTPCVRLSKGPKGEEIEEHLRGPDGIWYGPPDGRPQNTRLSGVLALRQIDPWNFASKKGLLVPNPWAVKPLPQLTLGTAELVQAGDRYEKWEGKPMHELFGLPASWPEE